MADPIVTPAAPAPKTPLSQVNAGAPPPTPAPVPPITPGTGVAVPPVLPVTPPAPTADELATAEAEKVRVAEEAAVARIADLRAKPEDQLTPEEKTELAAAPAEEPETDFWEDVDALRGEKIEIDWASQIDPVTNDPIDPMSPAGAYIREKAVAQKAVDAFDVHLQKTDPRGYAYLLHRQVGGTDEEFFAKKTITLPDYDTFTSSVDLQQKVYHDDLLRKGVSAKQAKMLVDQAVKDKEIFELADSSYKAQEEGQRKDLDAIAIRLEQDQVEFEQKVVSLNTVLTKEISTNSSMKFLIPDAKKPEFLQFVNSTLQHQDGKFFAVQELDERSAPRVLEALYLQFVQGDITGLVKRTAQTANTKRLHKTITKTVTPAAGAAPASTGKRTLGDLKFG